MKFLAVLLWVLASACALSSSSPRAGSDEVSTPSVTEYGFTVESLEASTRFFVDVLGAVVVGRVVAEGDELNALSGLTQSKATAVHLRLGEERVALVRYGKPGNRGRSDARSNDLDFQHLALVVRDMDVAYERVVEADVRAVSRSGPERIPDSNAASAGIRAFYFRDAEDHPLELIWFPADKGPRRWHPEGVQAVFLGVDHSAIAVASTDASLAFYRDGIGLTVAGKSFNEGEEQARLSGVDGARVRITGLRGPSGSGIEFLEYVAPDDGRPRPADSTVRDTFHWETSVLVADLARVVDALIAQGNEPVSTRIARCELCAVGRRAFILRDPDGHAVRLVED